MGFFFLLCCIIVCFEYNVFFFLVFFKIDIGMKNMGWFFEEEEEKKLNFYDGCYLLWGVIFVVIKIM